MVRVKRNSPIERINIGDCEVKVKTHFEGCGYLTAGKIYDVIESKDFLDQILFLITGDNGRDTWCLLRCCGHIDNQNWEIVEE